MADTDNTTPPLTEQAKQQAQQAVQQGRRTASHVWDLARGQFRSQLTGQKERAATGLSDISQLIRQSGSQLGEQGHVGSQHYADQIADRIAQIAGSVHEKEVEELLSDTENVARARPGLFLTIAAVLGFLLARFLKSSGPPASAAA